MRCIGYHFVVYRDGSIHVGRAIEEVGAHCKGHNSISIGICYIGGLSKADIDRWHRERGMRCIGYHFVVYRDGSIHVGRAIEEVGAHCKGHNSISIGICYIGGLSKKGKPKDTRTRDQKAAMRSLIEQLKEEYPLATIHGHNEFANKACPCFDVKKELG